MKIWGFNLWYQFQPFKLERRIDFIMISWVKKDRGAINKWLRVEDKQSYIEGLGLMRTIPVNPDVYNRDYFSGKNIAYAEGYIYEKRVAKYKDAINNIVRYLKPPILELGCGPGYLIEALRKKHVQVVGVDISDEAVNNLSLQGTTKFLCKSSITKLPFSDNEFNSGYSFHVLEHLTIAELNEALSEISRVVKSSLYMIIPTWDSRVNEKLFRQVVEYPTHKLIVNRQWWINKFREFDWEYQDELEDRLDRIKRGWVFFFEKRS